MKNEKRKEYSKEYSIRCFQGEWIHLSLSGHRMVHGGPSPRISSRRDPQTSRNLVGPALTSPCRSMAAPLHAHSEAHWCRINPVLQLAAWSLEATRRLTAPRRTTGGGRPEWGIPDGGAMSRRTTIGGGARRNVFSPSDTTNKHTDA